MFSDIYMNVAIQESYSKTDYLVPISSHEIYHIISYFITSDFFSCIHNFFHFLIFPISIYLSLHR